MPKTLRVLKDEVKMLRKKIKSAKKVDAKLVGSWVSRLVTINEQLIDRLDLMKAEMDTMEDAVGACCKYEGSSKKKSGGFLGLFGGKK